MSEDRGPSDVPLLIETIGANKSHVTAHSPVRATAASQRGYSYGEITGIRR